MASINMKTEADRVILNYRHRSGGGEWNAEEYPVRLDRRRCTYGGTRAWFICPAVGCGRRVAILYGGAIFACRHCYRLAYTWQREAAHYRALHRARKIYARLSGDPNCLDMPDKPKGMHWRTYERLSAEAEAAELGSWAGLADKMKLWRAAIG